MPGFLSEYSGTERYTFNTPSGKEYWIEIRKTLLAGDKEHAERALTSGRMDPNQGVQIDMDTVTYRQEMVLASIVAWNLDEEDGSVWPVTLANVKRLPGIEFDRVFDMVNKLNEPASKVERRDFRSPSQLRDSDEGVRTEHTVIPGEVLPRK